MHNRIRNKWLFAPIGSIILLAMFAMSACSPLTTSSLPTPTPTVAANPTVGQTETNAAMPSPTAVVTETPTVPPTATATKRPVTVTPKPSATPTSATLAGVFVSAIKIDPTPAKSNESPQFTVTFLNTTGKPQTYRWFVKVYMKDQPQSFGETSKIESAITPKTSQVKASSDWKTLVVTDCLFVIARVFWVDENNQVHEFLKSDATNPATGFSVCP
ncbi:MAG: hypothetical protein KGJ80_06210 [Chloroflexota bacterium]|nr:hypothetical protein [Chloroflexota bacterium]